MPKVSFASKIVSLIITLRGSKKMYSSKELAQKYIEKKRIENQKPYKIPLKYKLFTKELKIEGLPCFIISGKGNKHIFYLHGGTYIENPSPQHWDFLHKIHKETDANILVPIYPKTPTYSFQESFDQVLKVYQKMYKLQNPSNLILMGDSAGGGFALAFSMLLKTKKLKQPSQIILISPYLDLMLENPKIKDVEPSDKMLGVIGGREIAKQWSKNTNPNHYLLSPINGDLKNLPPISLFIGTFDILWPDCVLLKEKAIKEGLSINYYEYIGMCHDFPLLPIPEGKLAVKQIVELIKH
ncbi:MAG: alpha/beta hydrolase [Firmicutes bacterium]|nr:alpha/beta hydrolase [Bacillota bacterium]